jgi:hypothetical protein
MMVCPKVSGLVALRENCKWYSYLPPTSQRKDIKTPLTCLGFEPSISFYGRPYTVRSVSTSIRMMVMMIMMMMVIDNKNNIERNISVFVLYAFYLKQIRVTLHFQN